MEIGVWSRLPGLDGTSPEDVTAAIETLLDEGVLGPGDRLPPERELAGRLSLSRSTIREAFHELELKGLVERRQGRGTRVRPVSRSQVQLLGALHPQRRTFLEMHDLRTVVEPEVAARASVRATPADLVRMRQLLDSSAGELTWQRSAELDRRFHDAVAGATQNPLLGAVVGTMAGWIAEAREASHRTAEGRRRSLSGHWQVFEAISRGAAAEARAAMTEHLQLVSTLGVAATCGARSGDAPGKDGAQ
ncbi:FadR/GntR family transcriptional regulator [Amycolatopsis jejuensis]|uniref:FadR/GntR family transcriptional regulator n=1 Tax=Amycolatopsis jejuensis TaxID=330084 RepID=UPI00068D537F|nr:FadR/GntR family transcriptional regulator [Amycolatopsis jejuensis]